MNTTVLPAARPETIGKVAAPLAAVAAALVALADFLMFDQPAGLGYGLFALALGASVLLAQRPRHAVAARVLAVVAAAAPLIENVSALSLAVSLTALAAIALDAARRFGGSPAGKSRKLALFMLAAPFRLIGDLAAMRRVHARLGRAPLRPGAMLGWAMPVALGLVFVALFAMANPVLDHWLAAIDLAALLDYVDPARLAFWTAALVLVWAWLRPRLPVRRAAIKAAAPAPKAERKPRPLVETLFGRRALLRALVLFNLIFAVQTALDLAYLWGGVALPDGMTYAEYAHRGAYPLIVTALLAAAFVLATLRPGGERQDDRLLRRLVYLWIAQNVLLVISSILRLDLYVGVYALTYWRIAAFLWMGLVGVGLVLIVARIRLRQSNEWLMSANLLALGALAYACCFVNFAALIAGFNVAHSREISGQGVPLDKSYLLSLGPQAAPALARFARDTENDAPAAGELGMRWALLDFENSMTDWRAWSLRNLRLERKLAAIRQ